MEGSEDDPEASVEEDMDDGDVESIVYIRVLDDRFPNAT